MQTMANPIFKTGDIVKCKLESFHDKLFIVKQVEDWHRLNSADDEIEYFVVIVVSMFDEGKEYMFSPNYLEKVYSNGR